MARGVRGESGQIRRAACRRGMAIPAGGGRHASCRGAHLGVVGHDDALVAGLAIEEQGLLLRAVHDLLELVDKVFLGQHGGAGLTENAAYDGAKPVLVETETAVVAIVEIHQREAHHYSDYNK